MRLFGGPDSENHCEEECGECRGTALRFEKEHSQGSSPSYDRIAICFPSVRANLPNYIYFCVCCTSQGVLTFDRKKIESFYAFYKQNDERDKTTSKSKITGIHQDKILKLCIS